MKDIVDYYYQITIYKLQVIKLFYYGMGVAVSLKNYVIWGGSCVCSNYKDDVDDEGEEDDDDDEEDEDDNEIRI